MREGGLEPETPPSQTLQLQGLGEYGPHLSAFLSAFRINLSIQFLGYWLLQSPESLLQKGANNALYWQKICGQSEFLTISPRIFPMSMPTT